MPINVAAGKQSEKHRCFWPNSALSGSDLKKKFLLLLIFLFPVLTATVNHAGSTIYGLLTVLSFFYCREGLRLINPKEKRFLMGFLLFFFFSSLSLLMTEDLRVGVQRLERYARFVVLIPIYLMLRGQAIDTGKAFLAGMFAAVFIMLGQAFYEVQVLGAGVVSGAYNRIIMGDLAILFTSLIFIRIFFFGKNKIDFFFSILAVMAGLYVTLLAGSRNAFLFLPFITMSLLWLYRKRLSRRGWQGVITGIILLSFFLATVETERLIEGLDVIWANLKTFSAESNKDTVGTRFVMWRNSLLIFKDSPVFGTGMGDFMHDSIILLEKGLSYKNDAAVHSTNAHSIYFMLLAEGGLVGLSLLLLVLFVFPSHFVYVLWKETVDTFVHLYALLALVSILAFAWFGLSESWINRNSIINAYCMTLLVFISSAANRAEKVERNVEANENILPIPGEYSLTSSAHLH